MTPPPIKSTKQFYKQSAEEPEPPSPSSNLWVGNLAADVTDADLMDLFANYGALDSVTTYSSRSFAFVFFKRVEDAKAAKDALQATALRGNPIKIEFARPAKPCKNLWVGGISPAVSKEQLEKEFLRFGKIEDFKFLRDRNTAFVEYFKLEDAFQAMRNMNGKSIGGEQIRVDFLRSQPSRREQLPDFRDSRESPFSAVHYGARRAQLTQSSGGRKEGQPSNILWIGYPPSVQIDEQMLHNAMILFGEIERIKSFPSRHYSFVEFRSVDEARRAKEGLQGRLFNDPRITIMFSSSGLAPGKEYSFYPGVKGPRPEMFNEHLFGPMEILDHSRPMGLNNFVGTLPPNSIHRPNLPLRPFGPQGGLDPVVPGAEFNDLASIHSFRDGNSSIPMGPNWRRPSSPVSGVHPSASVMRPGMRPVSSGWDVLDPNQFERESKRSRIDAALSVDDDSFLPQNIDDRGLGSDKIYGLGPGGPGPYSNIQGKNSLSPAARPTMGGPPKGHLDNDYIWRGIVAKGGTPVCNARCVPIGKGIEAEIPEVINCSARTGLDTLTKHYAEAIGFEIVFFLPDSEDDFASYTEFLRYLGSKNRAGVAKFDDKTTTLFLVPPSDFLTKVLKVTGPERLYGVVLKLPQVVPSSASMQPQIRQPIHFSQYTDNQIPPPEADYNLVNQKEEHVMPMDYNRAPHEDTKLPSKSFYQPTTESTVVPSVPQDYASNNSAPVSQAGVSLTPELIATLASFLPANAQSSASESGQPALSSSSVRPSFSLVAPDKGTSSHGWKHDYPVSGNPSHFQLGNQFNSQVQVQSQFQPYPSVSNTRGHSANVVPGSSQIQDIPTNLPHQGVIPSRPSTSFAMPSQSGQFALPPQISQQYQVEVPHGIQRSYGVAHGTDVPGSYSPAVIQQPNNPVALSSQVQGVNYSQTQSVVPLSADKANWELSNQVQQFQSALSGGGQGALEVEADKNQRYQSTLQFAASLLLQIQQQQQQQQTSNPAARGSGNQQ